MSTKIEWTNATWNPVTGCTKYSEGCQNCYAEKMHKRLRAMGQEKYNHDFGFCYFHEDELNRDFGKKSKMIFVNSMSDTFHRNIDDSTIDSILQACHKNPQHIFQILTKRAERVVDFNYPKNVWLGVTVESEKHKNRIEYLKQTDAQIKFLSCEPLLGDLGELDLSGIDWVICGGESGHNARPCSPDWVRNIQKQCESQKVPFFFKQWGEWSPHCPQGRQTKAVVFKNTCTGKTTFEGQNIMYKVGKAKSGALLDGLEYKEFPRIIEEI